MSHDKVWPEYPHEHAKKYEQLSLEGLGQIQYEKEDLKRFEEMLKDADDAVLPESGVYFDALEARIMGALDAAIEAGEVEERTRRRDVIRLPLVASKAAATMVAHAISQRRSMSTRMGQLALLAAVIFIANGKNMATFVASHIEKRNPDSVLADPSAAQELLATHQAAPQVLTGTVMSYESDADLALEIAARRLVAYHQEE